MLFFQKPDFHKTLAPITMLDRKESLIPGSRLDMEYFIPKPQLDMEVFLFPKPSMIKVIFSLCFLPYINRRNMISFPISSNTSCGDMRVQKHDSIDFTSTICTLGLSCWVS